MAVNRKDLAAGIIFAGMGLAYGTIAWRSLPMGEALNMGPGYFPLVLSGLMALMGTVAIVRSLVAADIVRIDRMHWRAPVMLSLATLVFAGLLPKLGMFPGILATCVIASFAASPIRPAPMAVTCLGITLLCTLIFGFGIQLPIPMFGTWFR